MIKEAYCSDDVCKLLKEKGFKEPCTALNHLVIKDGEKPFMKITHQKAMAWLREQYDLHIIAFPYKANDKKKWCCQVYKTFNLLGYGKYINDTLDSYEDAVEAALKYSLENLI